MNNNSHCTLSCHTYTRARAHTHTHTHTHTHRETQLCSTREVFVHRGNRRSTSWPLHNTWHIYLCVCVCACLRGRLLMLRLPLSFVAVQNRFCTATNISCTNFDVFNNPLMFLYRLQWCSATLWRWSRSFETCCSYDKLCVRNVILTLVHLLILSCEFFVNAWIWITLRIVEYSLTV